MFFVNKTRFQICKYTKIISNDNIFYFIHKKSRDELTSSLLFYSKSSKDYSRWHVTVRPAITIETIDINLMRMFNDGPDVSLNGSPTVSPTTVAL